MPPRKTDPRIVSYERRTDIGQDADPRSLWPALVECIALDGMTVPDAARKAGYATTAAAYKHMRDPKVNAALVDLCKDRLGYLAAASIHTLEALLKSKSDRVRLEAANSILDRVGLVATATPTVAVQVSINTGPPHILGSSNQAGTIAGSSNQAGTIAGSSDGASEVLLAEDDEQGGVGENPGGSTGSLPPAPG